MPNLTDMDWNCLPGVAPNPGHYPAGFAVAPCRTAKIEFRGVEQPETLECAEDDAEFYTVFGLWDFGDGEALHDDTREECERRAEMLREFS
ncbi:hypothetical protein [Amaricoccus solimangrovi]|uniref:Uncharacterized protein n=1 Tax=Amaricoccus solimangrovi TaxID=2589815 RepID=A0A501X128_9RHOB|nr:hypothetical protein [Amaricoccus solimangrovi]TPE53056.1 hypothetical protein FJM51_03250 [Amaricoccus solimangrovi]